MDGRTARKQTLMRRAQRTHHQVFEQAVIHVYPRGKRHDARVLVEVDGTDLEEPARFPSAV